MRVLKKNLITFAVTIAMLAGMLIPAQPVYAMETDPAGLTAPSDSTVLSDDAATPEAPSFDDKSEGRGSSDAKTPAYTEDGEAADPASTKDETQNAGPADADPANTGDMQDADSEDDEPTNLAGDEPGNPADTDGLITEEIEEYTGDEAPADPEISIAADEIEDEITAEEEDSSDDALTGKDVYDPNGLGGSSRVISEALFPDSEFRRYISNNWDTNKDGKLTASEINAIEKITIKGTGDNTYYITSLRGIEFFTNLRELTVNDHHLSGTLDLTKNTKLATLDLYNKVGNDSLRVVELTGTLVTYVNVSNNIYLEELIMSRSMRGGWCSCTPTIRGLRILSIMNATLL